MKNKIFKFLKNLSIHIISFFVGISILIVFASNIIFPNESPNGENNEGIIMTYFNNIKGDCPSGKALVGFDKENNFVKICKDLGNVELPSLVSSTIAFGKPTTGTYLYSTLNKTNGDIICKNDFGNDYMWANVFFGSQDNGVGSQAIREISGSFNSLKHIFLENDDVASSCGYMSSQPNTESDSAIRGTSCAIGTPEPLLCIKYPGGFQNVTDKRYSVNSDFFQSDIVFNNNKNQYTLASIEYNTKNIFLTKVTNQGQYNGENILIATGNTLNNFLKVKLAYDDVNENYFIIWQKDNGSKYSFYGKIINESGTIIKDTFEIKKDLYNAQNAIDIIYLKGKNKYLIVYGGDTTAGYTSLYGLNYDINGNVVGSPFDISQGQQDFYPNNSISIDYNSFSEKFIVIYRNSKVANQIKVKIYDWNATTPLYSTNFLASTSNFKVASNTLNGEYMLTYLLLGVGEEIYTRKIGTNGTVGIPLQINYNESGNPFVEYLPNENKFVVSYKNHYQYLNPDNTKFKTQIPKSFLEGNLMSGIIIANTNDGGFGYFGNTQDDEVLKAKIMKINGEEY